MLIALACCAVESGGRATIEALPAEGGAHPLLDMPAGSAALVVGLAGAPGQVAALVILVGDDGRSLVTRIYGGPPSGPLTILREARFGRGAWAPYEVDADAMARVLAMEVSEARGAARGRLSASPGRGRSSGRRRSPAPDAPTTRASIVVADTRAGARVGELDIRDVDRLGASDIDLAPDGRLVAR